MQIDLDSPAQVGSASAKDQMSRKNSARNICTALQNVPQDAGLVVAIEGKWGSGKTWFLAMMEEALAEEPEFMRPVVVHFNPWLIGDKDALLQQFFKAITAAIRKRDVSEQAKRIAEALEKYSGALTLVKMAAGAEPWADLLPWAEKGLKAIAGLFKNKKPKSLDERRCELEAALKAFPRRVIVFIDDIDRLYSAEVFEMIRIIKMVGNFPKMAYVVAWDADYVIAALKSASVPHADQYLEKIVQLRFALPTMPAVTKNRMMSALIEKLHPKAMGSFAAEEERFGSLYFSGLRDLVQSPRDITRVFNVARVIEPPLRGEVNFADTLALAAMAVKANATFELLRHNPSLFVGRIASENVGADETKDIVVDGADARTRAYEASENPAAIRRMVHFLFPLVAEAEDGYSLSTASSVSGHIAHPDRLMIALKHGLTRDDASAESARRFLLEEGSRQEILSAQTEDNCDDFLELLGDCAQAQGSWDAVDRGSLALTIAEMVEAPPFSSYSRRQAEVWRLRLEDIALGVIESVLKGAAQADFEQALKQIVESPRALACAATLIVRSKLAQGPNKRSGGGLLYPATPASIAIFVQSVVGAAATKRLLGSCHPEYVLYVLSEHAAAHCPAVFSAFETSTTDLDALMCALVAGARDSIKGEFYKVGKHIEAYCPMSDLKLRAAQCLQDPALSFPARAAWMAISTGEEFYAVDGTPVSR